MLVRELSALYVACARGGGSPLPELPVQYADFAVWQREQLQGEVLDGQLAYWKAQLAGAPALLELPTDRPRPAVRTQRGRTAATALPPEVLDGLDGARRGGEDATLFMVLLAVFQALLSRYSGSDDVVVGTPIAGRTRAETEGLIGFFVNTLVLRTRPGRQPHLPRSLCAGCATSRWARTTTRRCRSSSWWRSCSRSASLSHSPLFQVMFTLNEAGGGDGTQLPGLAITPRAGPGADSQVRPDAHLLPRRRGAGGPP